MTNKALENMKRLERTLERKIRIYKIFRHIEHLQKIHKNEFVKREYREKNGLPRKRDINKPKDYKNNMVEREKYNLEKYKIESTKLYKNYLLNHMRRLDRDFKKVIIEHYSIFSRKLGYSINKLAGKNASKRFAKV